MKSKVSAVQKQYIFHWLRLILAAELVLLLAGRFRWIIFLAGAAAFFTGFILRSIKKYPGNPEPLVLDISSGALGILSAIICYSLRESPFLLIAGILLPFFVVVPHFVYILARKGLPTRFRPNRTRR